MLFLKLFFDPIPYMQIYTEGHIHFSVKLDLILVLDVDVFVLIFDDQGII